MRLSELGKNTAARITAFNDNEGRFEERLREIGFAEGDEVELLHVGPLARRPLCFRLNRTMIALRPEEAGIIEVDLVS